MAHGNTTPGICRQTVDLGGCDNYNDAGPTVSGIQANQWMKPWFF
jgi:hypothetical protein